MAAAEPSRLQRRLELVRAHVACENRHDFDGILATFGSAVAYEDQGWRERFPGSPVGLLGRLSLVLNHPLTIGRSLVRAIWKQRRPAPPIWLKQHQ